MDKQNPSIGRILHYRLSAQDADEINRRRVSGFRAPGWPAGAQAHVGSTVAAGDVFPLVVTRSWPNDKHGVNGQVLLDGNDTFWAMSRAEGTEPGTWSWPPRS